MTPALRDGNKAYRHSEAGFSLVEVMSALVILAIAMTAVFATFISQQKSFTVQSRVSEMQQNLRQAVEYISRDIRMAGYGIPDNVTIPSTATATGITLIRSIYPQDNTTGPDQIYILYLFDMDANQPPTILTFSGGNATTGDLTVANTTGFLPGGELILVTDGGTAHIYQTSGTTVSPTTLTFGGGYTTGHTKTYAAGSIVAKARFVRYFVDDNILWVDRNVPGQAAQPVADGIEDIQLTYGLDTSSPADGVVDSWVPSPSTAQFAQIRQVRLQLIARTRLQEAGWAETRPALGNRAAGTTSDGYRRRTYDIVIDVRNSGA